MEIWKTISEAPNYQVSNYGNVRRITNTEKGRILKTHIKPKTGYCEVGLCDVPNHRIWRTVHRLVLETFNPVPGMKKLEVNHKDEDKSNNKLSNLEWMTSKNNCNYGTRNDKLWLTRKRQKIMCIETNRVYANLKEAALATGIHKTTICQACKDYAAGGTISHHTAGGYHWRYINE